MRAYQVFAQLPPFHHPKTREWIANLHPLGIVWAEDGEDAMEQARNTFLDGALRYPVVQPLSATEQAKAEMELEA